MLDCFEAVRPEVGHLKKMERSESHRYEMAHVVDDQSAVEHLEAYWLDLRLRTGRVRNGKFKMGWTVC